MIAKVLIFLGVSALIYLAIAILLIFSQFSDDKTEEAGLDFSRQTGKASEAAPLLDLVAPDGETLHYRRFDAARDAVPLLMVIHGSGWHGGAYESLARRIAEAGLADVIVPDLRGHGQEPKRRGDIDYLGQLEDDLHALFVKERKQDQQLIMAGHSSGGGLVIRYAGGAHGDDLSGAILLAPYLKYNAPTARPKSGGWAHPLTRRIIGLTMLNAVGVRIFNHLPVIDFAFPQGVVDGPLGETATRNYSYRLNASYAPRSDYEGDLAKLPSFLLVAGEDDEAFHAERYEPTIAEVNTRGSYVLLPAVSHLDVIDADGTLEAIRVFLGSFTGYSSKSG